MKPAAAPAARADDVPETEVVHAVRIACDGGQGPLGHPRVWLSIDPGTGWVECPYCDKRFVLAAGAGGH
ncbi:MAG: zinc-finger domain-containing protein [Rhodobacteraceae bacterium]|nr:zinc-finger domain-containing protein [Paracoccaceae bacterium]